MAGAMDFRFHRKETTASTNADARAGRPMDVFVAEYQTAGRGRLDHRWHAARGENLTFSVVLDAAGVAPAWTATLPLAVALAVVGAARTLLGHAGAALRVKWPNDVLAGGRKLCGILCELNGDCVIAGIGLNVNQTEFPDWVPNPTSLALLTGREFDLEPLLRQLLGCIERRYDDLKNGLDLEPEYLERLLNIGVPARYKYNEEEITATITGVDPHGRLLLTAGDGRRLSCGMKEIVLL